MKKPEHCTQPLILKLYENENVLFEIIIKNIFFSLYLFRGMRGHRLPTKFANCYVVRRKYLRHIKMECLSKTLIALSLMQNIDNIIGYSKMCEPNSRSQLCCKRRGVICSLV